MIPADSVLVTSSTILCNESSLTGEPMDLKKNRDADCFLLSSCLVTEGEESRALVIGIGLKSQWGKIKANLVTEAANTPLQDKLEKMTTQVTYGPQNCFPSIDWCHCGRSLRLAMWGWQQRSEHLLHL